MCEVETLYLSQRRRYLFLARIHAGQCNAEDVVQEAFCIVLDRMRRGDLDMSRPLGGYLRSVVLGQARSARARLSAVLPYIDRGHSPSVLTRIAAAQLWGVLTPHERLAVTNLHFLEEKISRADVGLFTRRLRLASVRLRRLAS